MSKLIITEKPSVAIDIAKVLDIKNRKNGYIEGNGYIISWAVGHLVELADPETYNEDFKKWDMSTLPIVPSSFKLKTKKQTYSQYAVLKELLNSADVSEVICATDAGREGQLIFGWIYQIANSKKPVKRLWISSYTEKSIQKGFDSLKDNKEYNSLFESAQARAQADWLFGINATRALTCINNEVYSMGRVQTPTLALIVKRQQEIDDFIPVPYFQIQGIFKEVNFLYKNDENEANFANKKDAEIIFNNIEGKSGKVVKVETSKKAEERPQLYDLTELQREANIKYGLTAQETLDTAQSLYEKHKLITYPRTDSRYLGEDVATEIKSTLKYIGLGWLDSQPVIRDVFSKGLKIDKRIVNDDKVTDHHAIIPTEKAVDYCKMTLTDHEDKVYKLIASRLIAAVAQKYEYLETSVVIDVDKHMFYSTYKKPESFGWKNVYKELLASTKKDENIDVVFNEDEVVKADKYEILEKITTPPKPYTDASLLSAMENISKKIEDSDLKKFVSKGLGTPATRASIIERLKKIQYIESKGKALFPTQKGKNLIKVAPEKLKQPELTAEWEEKLENIRNNTESQIGFMTEIKEHIGAIIKDINNNIDQYKINSEGSGYGKKQSNNTDTKEEIGLCPKCKMPIYENKKAFSCSGYRNTPPCNFTLWKEDKWFGIFDKKITKSIAKSFLTKGECFVKGLKKKDKSATFDACITLDISSDKWVSFGFKQTKNNDC